MKMFALSPSPILPLSHSPPLPFSPSPILPLSRYLLLSHSPPLPLSAPLICVKNYQVRSTKIWNSYQQVELLQH
ncbi:hypothetical protein QUB50_26645, partial [Microcoleus sp. A6-C5]|uniref:hypothetical protein n=1 Tax=unclassified Microcoleus TaxID=2642155 RepID=UPI002FD645D4